MAEFARCKTFAEPFVAEYVLLARDGPGRLVARRGRVVRPDARQPGFLQGVMLDITERKRAEAAVHVAEAKHRSIVKNAL